MARVPNPRKVHNFFLVVNGVDQFEIQEMTFPEISVDVVEHGDTNFIVKTPGLFKIGTIQFKKLKRIETTDSLMIEKLLFAQNPTLGGGALPSTLAENIIIEERDTTNQITVGRILWEGCWISNVGQSAFSRTASENIIQDVTVQVEKPQLLL